MRPLTLTKDYSTSEQLNIPHLWRNNRPGNKTYSLLLFTTNYKLVNGNSLQACNRIHVDTAVLNCDVDCWLLTLDLGRSSLHESDQSRSYDAVVRDVDGRVEKDAAVRCHGDENSERVVQIG